MNVNIMRVSIRIVLCVMVTQIVGNPAVAQDNQRLFIDSLDNAFDMSKWLFDLHGFIPIFAPITEPAVGYGVVGAGVFFIPKAKSSPGQFKMPDITGAAGGYTQNGTWFAGGGYFGFWKDNSIRYRGVVGYGNINLKYYGSGDNTLATDPAKFSIESYFMLQQALFRIGQSNFMIGGNYIFNKTTVTAFEESKLPSVDPHDFVLTNSGITLLGEFESFNNILSPTRGIRMQLGYKFNHEILGSDRNYQRLNFFTHAYLPVTERWNIGLRFESLLASKTTPFYLLPYINLRGVPVLRYQGAMTVLGETEQYINIYNRWGIVAFGGYGMTFTAIEAGNRGANAWNAGGGLRYLIARMMGLQMGIDVARGPENWAFYIVFGSGWLK
jgi:hypothetical protein